MRKLNAEEQEFVSKLYEENADSLYRLAIKVLEPSSAKEAVQITFMDACKKIDDVMNSKNPQGWLVQALKFSISKIKRNRQQIAKNLIFLPPEADTEFSIEMGINDFPDTRTVDENVDILYCDMAGNKEFDLLKRFAVDGKSIKDIAEEDGIKLSACKTRIFRAKDAVRQWLEKHKD